jgi:quinol monooxygenase YgiN
MPRPLLILLLLAVLPAFAQAPADGAIYGVAYVDVMPSGRAAMVTALKSYRDASSKEAGFVRVDLLEQIGRNGRFVVLETWKDLAAFDAHGMSASAKQLQSALTPIRISGYDQRPYKSLNVAPATSSSPQAVHVVTHVDIGGGAPALAEAPALLGGLAEASRKERGAIQFDVLQHAMRANHFTIHEVWDNQAAVDAHAAAAHTRDYRDKVQPLSGSPVDERLFRVVE